MLLERKIRVKYQKPKGTADILPQEAQLWDEVEAKSREVFRRYRYGEIRVPLFESYDLYARSSGDTSDIVTKEMYDFNDKGGRHMALRPEGTAGVVRAYVENKLYGPEFPKPYRVYYMGPMFRYERPQSGRQREFHQIGVEAFGSDSPLLDAETIQLGVDLLHSVGVHDLRLAINTLGDPETRQAYHQALVDYFTPHKAELSEDSQIRLAKNPLRILDSKDPQDKPLVADAPSILDYLTPAAQAHFSVVKESLDKLGIAYVVDPTMVRGLDYYNHTIFEIMTTSPAFGNKELTVLAGGRYDGLVEQVGGPALPGVGFGLGTERLMLLVQHNRPAEEAAPLNVYIASLSESAGAEALVLAHAIREAGYTVDMDFLNRKAKSQFKTANRENAQLVITLGEDELAHSAASIKQMATGQQIQVPFAEVTTEFHKIYQQLVEEGK